MDEKARNLLDRNLHIRVTNQFEQQLSELARQNNLKPSTITQETGFSNGYGIRTISQRIFKEKGNDLAGRYSKESEPDKSGSFTVYA